MVFMSSPQVDRVSQIVAHLEQAILSGELAPGDRLPPEREISAQLGVSRSVVREAINRLASLGLILGRQGSGNRVATPNSRPVTVGYERMLRTGTLRLEDLVEVRLPLESALARLAAIRRTDVHLRELAAAQEKLAAPGRTLTDYMAADLEFHATLAAASGNPIFAMVLVPLQELLMESRRRTLERDGREVALAHHAAILVAVERRDPQAAEAAMRHHLTRITQHSPKGPSC